jgi:nitrogenase iron protein
MIAKKFQIGIYGKGGIGKSTITANLTAALGLLGKKVFQIGCDPKSDSTKLLLHGLKQEPMLEILKEKSISEIKIEDFMDIGFGDVFCTEAGGPKAGVGCAGRGIITMMEVLKLKGIFDLYLDYIFYDILGDVVCGGFSVPLRKGYADGIIIVTSGEFQSLYAANNICKGVRNLDSRLIGVIGNSRNIENEKSLIEEFCKKINSELLAFIPNSKVFREAEVNRKTLLEYDHHHKISKIFYTLADKIIHRDFKLKKPASMSDEEFEDLNYKYLGIKKSKSRSNGNHKRNKSKLILKLKQINSKDRENLNLDLFNNQALSKKEEFFFKKPIDRIISKSIKNRETLHGCSIAGAFQITSQIKDYITVMHSPSGCGYINNNSISSASLIEKIYGTVNTPSLYTRLLLTNMEEKDVIFGGKQILQDCIKTAVGKYNQKKIFIITSCSSAIIGDSIEDIISELKLDDDIEITVIDIQGVVGGDYFQGMLDAYKTIAEEYIDKTVEADKENNYVNILNEKTMLGDTDYNFRTIEKLLSFFDIKVFCRFVRNTNIEQIKKLKQAQLTIPYDDGFISSNLAKYLKEKFKVRIFDEKLPVGFDETASWLEKISAYFNKQKYLGEVMDKYSFEYNEKVKSQKKVLAGKSIVVFAFNSNLNWMVKTFLDLDMDLKKICFLRSAENEETPLKYDVDIEYNFDELKGDKLIKNLKPDIVLAYIPPVEMVEGVHYDYMPFYPKLGFYSGLELSKKWIQMFATSFKEGWRNEEKLFTKLQY